MKKEGERVFGLIRFFTTHKSWEKVFLPMETKKLSKATQTLFMEMQLNDD
jgi:hypothetical protein